jgi:hypothetical protein
MNAENSLDLFTYGRMGTIADGVTSLLEGREPPSPPSNLVIFIVYAALFALLVLQARGIAKAVGELRRGRVRRGRIGPWWRVGLLLVVSLVWALFVLVLLPKQLGLPLFVIANGFPDLVYLLLASALVAVGWAVVKAVWTYAALRAERAAQLAAASASRIRKNEGFSRRPATRSDASNGVWRAVSTVLECPPAAGGAPASGAP